MASLTSRPSTVGVGGLTPDISQQWPLLPDPRRKQPLHLLARGEHARGWGLSQSSMLALVPAPLLGPERAFVQKTMARLRASSPGGDRPHRGAEDDRLSPPPQLQFPSPPPPPPPPQSPPRVVSSPRQRLGSPPLAASSSSWGEPASARSSSRSQRPGPAAPAQQQQQQEEEEQVSSWLTGSYHGGSPMVVGTPEPPQV